MLAQHPVVLHITTHKKSTIVTIAEIAQHSSARKAPWGLFALKAYPMPIVTKNNKAAVGAFCNMAFMAIVFYDFCEAECL